MNYSLEWKPEYFEPVIIFGTVIFSLVGYWLTIQSSIIHKLLIRKHGEEKAKISRIFFWRFAGLFYFLLIPICMALFLLPHRISEYGIEATNLLESLLWITGLGIVIVLFQSRFARNSKNLEQYPQIRVAVWDTPLIIKNAVGWFVYLLSYEFLFRGFLLFGSVYAFGVWPGIFINTAFYSLSHLPKGARETLLAIPFGIAICYLTLRTGTIWIAIFVHFILAVSNDLFSMLAHPEMKYKK